MKKAIKDAVRKLIDWKLNFLTCSRPGRFVYNSVLDSMMSRTQTVNHAGLALTLSTPNDLARFRARTFSEKEPETLEWIDGMTEGSILWDIGANIGLYSCYAAKRRGCRVFAFEPSVFNLELLARNAFLNGLAERITIVPLPLAEKLGVSKLNMTSTEWSGAMSTFGEDYGHDGRPLAKIFEFTTVGLSMTDAIALLKIPQPDYIKMDVDGIEHLILSGGLPVLQAAKGILIEINDKFEAQSGGANRQLEKAGFKLKEKRHSEFLETDAFRNTFNQIWVKPG